MGTLHNLFEASSKQEVESKTDSFSESVAQNVANKKRQARERHKENAKLIRAYRLSTKYKGA